MFDSLIGSTFSGPRLLMHRGPLAVGRLVITIGVQSVERVIRRWAWPHVVKKVVEVQPPFANTNAPCSISGVGNVVGIEAASFHRLPTGISGMQGGIATPSPVPNTRASTGKMLITSEQRSLNSTLLTAITKTIPEGAFIAASNRSHSKRAKSFANHVRRWLRFLALKPHASTGLTVTIAETRPENRKHLATLTLTYPHGLSALIGASFKNSQPGKHLSGHVFELNHNLSIAQTAVM